MTATRRMLGGSVLSLAVLGAGACRGGPTQPSPGDRSIVVNGASRTYSLHVPPSFQAGVGALLVALHGAGDRGSSFEASTGLSATADQRGFAVVYPDGLFDPRSGVTDWEHFGDDFVDDVGFLRQLVTVVGAQIQSDPKRTYIAGFSDGGRLAHRAGVELSDLIAAIGDVGGSLFQGAPVAIPLARGPISVLILHGDADAYCGSPVDASQDQTFDYWVGGLADGCSGIDPMAPLCDPDGNLTSVVSKHGQGCGAGTAVTLYRLIGARHAWYGTLLNVPGQVPFNPDFGATTGVTTNDVIWNFFDAHPKR